MQPEAMPGLACGITILRCTRAQEAPRSRAASTWLVSRLSMAVNIGKTMNRM